MSLALNVEKKHIVPGISVIVAYALMDPLIEDIQDTFGKSFVYHPAVVWMCIICLVYIQTESWAAGMIIVVAYEAIKIIWREIHPEAPAIAKVRRLLHSLQNGEKLSDEDIRFLDNITPNDVSVRRK